MRFDRIVLASASPRRRELLKQVGIEFEVIPSQGEEIIDSDRADEIVKKLSNDKALEVSRKCGENTLVIGADTVVAVNNKILGKPADREEAFRMISGLRNGYHSVYTGVTLIYNEIVKSFVVETKVYVYDMSDEEVYEYIDTNDCYDKAGGYGIQGYFARYVEKIEGDYYNVVGLPVSRLIKEMKDLIGNCETR